MTSSIHADTKNTVRISARRFEQSPFYDCYANDQTVLGMVAGRWYGVFNGEDPIETYWRLRRKAVLYDVPEKPWQIEGPDAVPFLEYIFARPVGTLKEGRGRYAIACAPDGGTFMDGILFRMEENRFWYVQPDGDFRNWAVALSGGYNVTISDPYSRVLQLQGPKSFEIIRDLTNGSVTEEIRYFHSGFHEIGGQQLYVSRTGWTGELGFEIYTNGDQTDCPKLFNDIMEAGAPHGVVYGSMASMEIRRIEAGILDNLTDFDLTMTPFAAGLGKFIDLDKEGFLGREALLSANQECRLLGAICKSGTPAYQGHVWEDDRAIGLITAATWSPTLECGIAYLRFDEPGPWVGQMFAVDTEDGSRAEVQIVELPFFDQDKRIPRGLEIDGPGGIV